MDELGKRAFDIIGATLLNTKVHEAAEGQPHGLTTNENCIFFLLSK